ncbi:MAG: nicotinate-nucleotide adenylyltransferase [Candidatus Azobacteroides sp.]|nr:nicotinate-nucleotide adenylyltransferase [Candidatus Azobacteroides sp.]
MIRTAIFSGSFNPVHIGHLMLANYIAEYEPVDEIWFVLSPQNPLKQQSGLLADRLRLRMLNLALEDFQAFKSSDIELSMPLPSYTIRTLNTLKEQYPEREFILIIGSDNWLRFYQWKDYQEILSHYSVWVYPRPGYPVSDMKLPQSVRMIDSPVFEISSTDIREAFRQGKNLKAFLPYKVYNFIKENTLYT